MARTGRRFPSHVYAGQRQGLAVPTGAVVTSRPQQLVTVQDQAPFYRRGRQRSGAVIQARWPGYQWVGLPPINPLPKQVIVDQAVQAAVRRYHHGSVIQNRWPGYEWVGLPAILPLPKQVVQDQAAVWTTRLERRRGLIVEPGVQLAAFVAGQAPPTVTPSRGLVVQARVIQEPQRRRGDVIAPPVQYAASAPAAPVVTPLPRQIIILARATPKTPRRGHVIQPRTITAPTAPPRTITVVDLCPATIRRPQRGGSRVIVGRPVTAPVLAPRPNLVHTVQGQQRRRRGGLVAPQLQPRIAAAPFVPPSTLSLSPMTGIVFTGDTASIRAGDTGLAATGDTGTVKTGDTAYPRI